MEYLLIPIAVFLPLFWLAWLLMRSMTEGKNDIKAKIGDLDGIVSILMTTALGEPSLRIRIPKRVTWLTLTFPDGKVKLELPLVTRLQQSRRERYLEIARNLGPDARISDRTTADGQDYDLLTCTVDGPPEAAAAAIRYALLELFEIDADRKLEFRVLAHHWDCGTIRGFLHSRHENGDAQDALPEAGCQDADGKKREEEVRTGCLMLPVYALLLPLPFVFAYLQFGYVVASGVLVAAVVSWTIYKNWRNPKKHFQLRGWLRMAVLALPCATIYFGNPLYLQIVPTVLFSAWAVAELLSVSFGWEKLSFFERPEKIMSYSTIIACVASVAMNEFLRANISLDSWIWFFAFNPIEFALSVVAVVLPWRFYAMRVAAKPATDGNSP